MNSRIRFENIIKQISKIIYKQPSMTTRRKKNCFSQHKQQQQQKLEIYKPGGGKLDGGNGATRFGDCNSSDLSVCQKNNTNAREKNCLNQKATFRYAKTEQ
jgi:hypothetical protein